MLLCKAASISPTEHVFEWCHLKGAKQGNFDEPTLDCIDVGTCNVGIWLRWFTSIWLVKIMVVGGVVQMRQKIAMRNMLDTFPFLII